MIDNTRQFKIENVRRRRLEGQIIQKGQENNTTNLQNITQSKTNTTETRDELRNGKQFLLHLWYPSCNSYNTNLVISHERRMKNEIATTIYMPRLLCND